MRYEGRTTLAWVAAVSAAIFAACLISRLPLCTASMHTSDSADYLRSVRFGLLAHYLDSGSVGFTGAAKLYLERPEIRTRMWDHLYREVDLAALRHFHVPLSFYPHAVAQAVGASSRTHRVIPAIFGALLAAASFLLLIRSGVNLAISVLAVAGLAASPAVVWTSVTFSPHALFLLLATLFLFLFSGLPAERSPWRFCSVLACGAAAVATLEISPQLAGAALGALLLSTPARRRLVSLCSRRRVLAGGACLVGTLLVCWPGGLLKGSYLLSYGAYAFLVVFRRTSYFGEISPAAALQSLSDGNAAVLVLYAVVLAGGAWLAKTRSDNFHVPVFLCYSLLALAQGLANNFRNASYAAHFIVPIWILLAFCAQEVLDSLRTRRTRVGMVLCLCIGAGGLLWNDVRLVRRQVEREEATAARLAGTIRWLDSHFAPGTAFLVNRYRETFHAYAPQFRFEPTTSHRSAEPRPWLDTRGFCVLLDPRSLEGASLSEVRRQYRFLPERGHENPGGFLISCERTADR